MILPNNSGAPGGVPRVERAANAQGSADPIITPRFQQRVAELLGGRTVRSTRGCKPRPPAEDVE